LGVGVGVWDLTDGDNRAGTLLIHTALPLTRAEEGRGQMLFALEGRLFLNQLDHIDNNYQGWVGIRYIFRSPGGYSDWASTWVGPNWMPATTAVS
jgi:hypothetical protein